MLLNRGILTTPPCWTSCAGSSSFISRMAQSHLSTTRRCIMESCPGKAMRPPQSFETQRLSFRPPTLDDAQAAFEQYAWDPEVTRYLTWEPHTSVEKTLKFMRRCVACWADGSAFPWVILTKENRQLIGMI